MGAKTKTGLMVLGGVALGGLGLWALRRFGPADVEETVTQDEVSAGRRATSSTTARKNAVRQAKASSKGPLMLSLAPMATVKIKVKEPKFVISYSPGGTGKHGSDWDKGGRLRKMYTSGDVVSLSRAKKLLANSTKGMLFGRPRVIVSTPQQVANAMLNLKSEPDGMELSELPDWGDTIKLNIPAGTYVLSPEAWPHREHHWKFFTKYWAWTSKGPFDLADPKAPGQPKYAIEAVKKFLKDDCTKWFTYVDISFRSNLGKSWKAVELKQGSNGTVTLQPYVTIYIKKWKKKEAGSIAYNAWCETTSLAVKAAMVASGGQLGTLAALLMKGAGIFAK